MGSINLRIDDELKARSYAALEKMGVTSSEALRLMLEYIADNEQRALKEWRNQHISITYKGEGVDWWNLSER